MDSLKDWVWLGIEALAILGAVITFVWKAVKQPIETQLENLNQKLSEGLKSQGERLGNLESSDAVFNKRLEEMMRQDQQHSFEIAAIQREQGRFEAMMARVDKSLDAQNKTNTDLLVALGQLNTRMDIFGELRDALKANHKRETQR